MKKKFSNPLASPMFLSAAIVAGSVIIYLFVQQHYRREADLLPDQYANEANGLISLGYTPAQVVNMYRRQNMDTSMDVFIQFYDLSGNLLASTAALNGTAPKLPKGVFTTATEKGLYKVTWQPAPGVRNAMCIIPFHATGMEGFIAAGRSLKYAELKIRSSLIHIIIGCLCILIAIFGFNKFPFFQRYVSTK